MAELIGSLDIRGELSPTKDSVEIIVQYRCHDKDPVVLNYWIPYEGVVYYNVTWFEREMMKLINEISYVTQLSKDSVRLWMWSCSGSTPLLTTENGSWTCDAPSTIIARMLRQLDKNITSSKQAPTPDPVQPIYIKNVSIPKAVVVRRNFYHRVLRSLLNRS